MSKLFVLVGGPNGSGKTTLVNDDLKSRKFYFLNTDEIQKSISTQNNIDSVILAGKIALSKAKEFFEEEKSFLMESTLSGKLHLKLLEQAKSNGYKTRLDFICLNSPKYNVDRVKIRVAEGGHDVPEIDIIRRYHRSLALLSKYLKIVDSFRLYDNTFFRTKVLHVIKGKSQAKIIYKSDEMPEWTKNLSWS